MRLHRNTHFDSTIRDLVPPVFAEGYLHGGFDTFSTRLRDPKRNTWDIMRLGSVGPFIYPYLAVTEEPVAGVTSESEMNRFVSETYDVDFLNLDLSKMEDTALLFRSAHRTLQLMWMTVQMNCYIKSSPVNFEVVNWYRKVLLALMEYHSHKITTPADLMIILQTPSLGGKRYPSGTEGFTRNGDAFPIDPKTFAKMTARWLDVDNASHVIETLRLLKSKL